MARRRKRRGVYLSLDIDFWRTAEPAIAGLRRLTRFADKRRIPLYVVMNHQQLLPYVNASRARTLINVDEHSDLASMYVDALDCGSWVAYVRWRDEGRYLWVRSHEDASNGCCSIGPPPWDDHDWNVADTRYADQDKALKGLLTDDVVGIGVCLSPTYAPIDVYDAARELLQGRPYKKGRLNDDTIVRRCLPPFPMGTLTAVSARREVADLPGVQVRGRGRSFEVRVPPEHLTTVWKRMPHAGGGWMENGKYLLLVGEAG